MVAIPPLLALIFHLWVRLSFLKAIKSTEQVVSSPPSARMDLHARQLFALLILWSLVTLAYFNVRDVPLTCCDLSVVRWAVTLIFVIVPAVLPLLGAHFAARQIRERNRRPIPFVTTILASFGSNVGMLLVFLWALGAEWPIGRIVIDLLRGAAHGTLTL